MDCFPFRTITLGPVSLAEFMTEIYEAYCYLLEVKGSTLNKNILLPKVQAQAWVPSGSHKINEPIALLDLGPFCHGS